MHSVTIKVPAIHLVTLARSIERLTEPLLGKEWDPDDHPHESDIINIGNTLRYILADSNPLTSDRLARLVERIEEWCGEDLAEVDHRRFCEIINNVPDEVRRDPEDQEEPYAFEAPESFAVLSAILQHRALEYQRARNEREALFAEDLETMDEVADLARDLATMCLKLMPKDIHRRACTAGKHQLNRGPDKYMKQCLGHRHADVANYRLPSAQEDAHAQQSVNDAGGLIEALRNAGIPVNRVSVGDGLEMYELGKPEDDNGDAR